ncbi:MAG: hypothetical protein WD271_02755 [Acidimicrobiia bacterium]
MQRRRGDARRRVRPRGVVALASLITVTFALAGCSGGGDTDNATVIEAGPVDIKLPQGYKVVHGKIVAPTSKLASASTPASGASGATAAADSSTGTTIPLDNKEDPTKTLFAALGKFRTCLDDLGVKFIGAPNAADPSSPTNDPSYLESLTTCAARSNIVQALQASQGANDNLSPADIERRNKGYLIWRSCMIDRGWKIDKPKPDSQGRLFAFGGSGGSQSQIQAPPGKDLLSSKDVEECAGKAQKATGL